MSPSDTRQAGAVLAHFPGPVTLYVSRRKHFIALVLCLAFTAFVAWLAMNPSARLLRFFWYDTAVAWISLAVGIGMSIRAVVLLVRPARLSLDGDAFEIGHAFRRIRVPWFSVGGFQVDRTGTRALTVMYEVFDSDRGSQSAAKAAKHLPDNYGLRREELAWLMNAWCERSRAPR